MALDRRIRTEDYLNDKLQSQADLDNLESLIQSVKEQQDLFKSQLLKAQSEHDEFEKQASSQRQALSDRANAFRRTQVDIDKRMRALTSSEVSDDSVAAFSGTMKKIGELEIAEHYVELLNDVEKHSRTAIESFAKSPESALQPFADLQSTLNRFRAARPHTEDAAPHLNDYITETAKKLFDDLKDNFSKDLEKTLHKLGWPKKGLQMDAASEQDWIKSVELLLDLQKTGMDSQADDDEPILLLPMEVMMKPLAARFRYHFSGDRPTNRLDKPEYFLSHAIDLCNDYNGFFSEYLQPVLSRYFAGTNFALNSTVIDSTSALVTAVLPMLRDKLRNTIPEVSKKPHFLSHLIHEVISFDNRLREEWSYGAGSMSEWKGLAGELLDDRWFTRWLDVEKSFALNRYQTIIDAEDSGELDFDSLGPGTTKPTKAAICVNDLLETITDRYRPLASFKQKLSFVTDIQLAIFDRYHGRLSEALDAFVTLSNPLARKVQGYTREDAAATQGVNGLDRLCRVYGSAEYLTRKMSDWSNDVFFLELWDELQFRSRESGSSPDNPAAITMVNQSGENGAFFDEVCSHYEKLRFRTEEVLCEQLFGDIRESLRPYNRSNPWSSLEVDTSVSPALDATLQVLSEELGYLSKCLASGSLRRICRSLLHQSEGWFWDYIIQRNNFSTAGVEQLKRDIDAFRRPFDVSCGQNFGQSCTRRLQEALTLMELPIEGDAYTLREAESRIFKSNEEARSVLDDLGFFVLIESDARSLVEKRVELSA